MKLFNTSTLHHIEMLVVLSILLFIIKSMVWSLNFSGGDGSQLDPFQLKTVDDIKELSSYVLNGNKTNGLYYVLTNDIDFTDVTDFIPIGGWSDVQTSDCSNSFQGKFNGRGYIISNLSVDRGENYYIGLFGKTSGAEIKNLGIVNCNIKGNGHVGGLVGLNSNSTITNCYVKGNVTGNGNIGGLVGWNSLSSTISDCYTFGVVNGKNSAGGLVGFNSSASINNCYSTGSVICKSYIVGGLVGYSNKSTIENCYSSCTVTGLDNAGSLIGWDENSTIANCYYDKQMSPFGGINNVDVAGQTEGKLTAELTSATYLEGFVASHWVLAEGYYPQLGVFITNNVPLQKRKVALATTPILLSVDNTIDNINQDFTVPTTNSADTTITWTSSDSSIEIRSGTVIVKPVKQKVERIILTATVGDNTKQFIVNNNRANYPVTVHQPASGTLTIKYKSKILNNNDLVPSGAKLVVEYLAADYALSAIKVNGVDTFKSKQFIVAQASTVEAVVTKKDTSTKKILDGSIKLYPNPARDVVTVSIPENKEMMIYSLSGVQLMKAQLAAGTQDVNLEGLLSGSYVVRFTGLDGNTSSSKLVVK